MLKWNIADGDDSLCADMVTVGRVLGAVHTAVI